MAAIEPTTRRTLNELNAGDRIRVTQTVRVGMQSWTTTVEGIVQEVQRRRHGLHFRRNIDDKVFSDVVVLLLDDGSVSTLAIDEYTQLSKV